MRKPGKTIARRTAKRIKNAKSKTRKVTPRITTGTKEKNTSGTEKHDHVT